jgi:hypothetical protein
MDTELSRGLWVLSLPKGAGKRDDERDRQWVGAQRRGSKMEINDKKVMALGGFG